MLKTYRIYNPTVRFSKYKFNNKFMVSITLLKVVPSVTWIHLSLSLSPSLSLSHTHIRFKVVKDLMPNPSMFCCGHKCWVESRILSL